MAPLIRFTFPLLAILLIVAPCAVSSTSLGADDLTMLDRFHRWMSMNSRAHPSADEKLHRFKVYRHNVGLIDASNRDAERLGYELGENEFTDLTNEEFMATYSGAVYVGPGAGGGIITTLAGDVIEGMVSSESLIHDDGNLTTTSDLPRQFDWRGNMAWSHQLSKKGHADAAGRSLQQRQWKA
ncbi:hypothetical protein ACQ4PT_049865 [Festuca glaucescens]